MWERLQKLLDRIESRYALGFALYQGVPVLGAGAVSGWLSNGVDWINQFGWFGWWSAFLVGSLVAALIFAALALAKAKLATAKAIAKWRSDVADVNPLDEQFSRVRIDIAKIANPVTRRITGKSFSGCEVIGPANIAVRAQNVIHNPQFIDCDIVVCRPDRPLHSVTWVDECSFIQTKFFNCTIFVLQPLAMQLYQHGAPIASFSGVPEIDNQELQEPEAEIRP